LHWTSCLADPGELIFALTVDLLEFGMAL
jgi:hypothetical protein